MANTLRHIVKFSNYSFTPLIRSKSLIINNKRLISLSLGNPKIQSKKHKFNSHAMTTKFGYANSSLDEQFSKSQKLVTTLTEEPDNEIKLQLYALFKQGTIGKCSTSKPGALDFVGRAKWQAWTGLGSISQEEAKMKYIETVNNLLKADNQSTTSSDTSSETQYDGLKVTKEGSILTIMLNRPQKKNAITQEMYKAITLILNEADKDNSVGLLVMRGAGDYFSSGNDLGNFIKMATGEVNLEEVAQSSAIMLRNYVDSFINFSKPLLGVINGPAVGISVTVLGLFDIVYAVDKATFHTPFSALGQSPEGCSSYTFPRLMGAQKANEILMLNKKITAVEAKNLGLLTEIFPSDSFDNDIEKKLKEIAALPKLSLAYAKQLTRNIEIETLRKVNELECERLRERWLSDDCKNAIMAFFQGKSKY